MVGHKQGALITARTLTRVPYFLLHNIEGRPCTRMAVLFTALVGKPINPTGIRDGRKLPRVLALKLIKIGQWEITPRLGLLLERAWQR